MIQHLLFALGCANLCVAVGEGVKGLLVVVQAQIEGQMAPPANSTDCHLLLCGRRGRSVYMCVCVRHVVEEVSDGGGAEPEQLIKH